MWWHQRRVESTSKEREREIACLGVRSEHIGLSGESWSMFPGSWLTRGIGYKATRPADWFILSAIPAHAVIAQLLRLSASSPCVAFRTLCSRLSPAFTHPRHSFTCHTSLIWPFVSPSPSIIPSHFFAACF